jgi:hypothetical protein
MEEFEAEIGNAEEPGKERHGAVEIVVGHGLDYERALVQGKELFLREQRGSEAACRCGPGSLVVVRFAATGCLTPKMPKCPWAWIMRQAWALSAGISGRARKHSLSRNLQNAGAGRRSLDPAASGAGRGRDHRIFGHPDRGRSHGAAARRAGFRAGALESGAGCGAVARLRDFDPERDTKFVGDAIRSDLPEAGPDVPVIGFAAAPWTLACYMIEGRTRGDISRGEANAARAAGGGAPAARSHRAGDARISEIADRGGRVRGAAFRYLGGELSRQEYDEFELPATQQMFEALRGRGAAPVPKILFAKGSRSICSRAWRNPARTS